MSFLSAAVFVALACPQEHAEDFEGTAGAWEPVRSERHPPYNRVGVEQDPSRARSGSRYLRMVSQGGDTAAELHPKAAWAVEPGRAYRLSAFARLDGTRRNTASISLVWRDAEARAVGMPLRSPPVSTPGAWQDLVVEAPRIPAGAVAATVRLDFEGPDVRGQAGFDRVLLEPCVLLLVRPAGRELAVFDLGEPVAFEVTAYGTGEEAGLEVVARTASGKDAAHVEWPIAAGTPVRIELPRLDAGSYHVEATLSKGEARLATRRGPLLIPNPRWLGSDRPWCGLRFEPSKGAGELARLSGIQRAVVEVEGSGALETLRSLAAQSVKIIGVGNRRPPGAGEFVDAWETSPGPAVPGGNDGADLLRRLVRLAASPTRPERVDVAVRPGTPLDVFLALRAANDILSDARPRGDLGGAPIQAAFENAGETVVALWSEGALVECEMPWGDRAQLYDPRAGIRALGPSERITVGAYPVFVGRVDASRVSSWLALRMDDDTVPLRRGPVVTAIRFRPPAPRESVSDLRVSLRPPAGWIVRPAEAALSWPEGQDASQDVSFLLPSDEGPGIRELGVEVSYRERGRLQRLQRTIPLRVTSPIEVTVTRGDKVAIRIANGASRALTLVATVRLPGLPEKLEFLSNLQPGASRTLEYSVKDPDRVEVLVEERTGERLFRRITR